MAVDIADAAIDLREQFRSVEPAEAALGDYQHLPDERRRIDHLLVALGRIRAKPHGGEGRLHHVRGSEMPPVLPRNNNPVVHSYPRHSFWIRRVDG